MIIKKLSKFIVNLDYKDIPETAINKAKLCFLDFLGVSNRGFYEESTQIAIKSINQLFDYDFKSETKKSSIIGNGYSNIAIAGFINGISAHVLDLDDGHRFAQIHPGAVVFPTAISIAEANKIDGKKFLEAVVGGYEIAIILGKLANPYHRNQGFHTTGTIGTFTSGAVASKLLNLNLEETINTLGLCGTQSSGLLEVDHKGTMGKAFHAGKAVYNGILSGYLAKNGFTGPESIVDGDEGFLKAMCIDFFKNLNNNLNYKDYLSSYLNENIGKFHIKEVYFKKYPFCRHIHSSIDAIFNIKNKYNFNVEDIEKIIVKTYKIASEHNNFNPKNKEEIKQSLPYAIAVAIGNNYNYNLIDIINIFNNEYTNNNIYNKEYNDNSTYNNEYNDNNIHNKKYNDNSTYNNEYVDINNYNKKYIENILNKIVIEENEEFTNITPKYRPSNVIIITKNGTFQDLVKLPLGEAETPLSDEDILKKFRLLNPNFDLEKLKPIQNIESYTIYDFMKNFH